MNFSDLPNNFCTIKQQIGKYVLEQFTRSCSKSLISLPKNVSVKGVRVLLAIMLILGQVSLAQGTVDAQNSDHDKNKAKLLSYIIGKQLNRYHFSQKPIDDSLSEIAYKLYFKQVDPRKRFYLKKDLEALQNYTFQLDDEMRKGKIQFPVIAEETLKQRVVLVQQFLDEIIDAGFDLEKKESLEVDNDKIDFCKTEQELKERWRKTLKYQISSQYLDLIDIQEAQQKEGKPEENEGNSKEKKSDIELRQEAQDKVIKSNKNLLSRILKRESKDQYSRYFSIIAKAFDPHSSYMPPTQKEDFDIHMRGSLEGIGAVLQEEDGFIKVLRIIPGGAAYRQKQLEAEDIIMMVAQGYSEPVDIADMRIRDAVALIRGKKGSEVRLTVKKSDGKIIMIPIIRDVVQLEETFVKSAVIKAKDDKAPYGYVKIPSFYRDFQATRNGGEGRNVTDDVKEALQYLEKFKIKGLIIDLRNNGGGALVDAVRIAGLFIKSGPVVQIKTIDDAEVLYDHDTKVYYDGPMLVLVNRFSASASEIFAAAMQDYNRALIIGSEHSYGKGTVQTLINLDNNLPFFTLNMSKYKPLGALKVTTQKFYRVNGESTQHRGVVPDIILPDRFKFAELGEQYVDNSLPWDEIAPVDHDNWPDFKFDIKKLKPLSTARVLNDHDFIEIEKEAKEGKERLDDTLVHIDLQSIKDEREKIKSFTDSNSDKAHGGMMSNEDKPDHELTKEEEEEQLLEKIYDDPYVTESLHILDESM